MKRVFDIGGYIIGIIGIVISIFLYEQTKKDRVPTFITEPIRTEILNSNKLVDTPIRVFKADNEEIKHDLVAIRFYFWNKGKESIKRENILSNVYVKTSNGTKIVNYRILKSSRDICGLSLRKIDSNRLQIDFSILEENDGFTVELLVEGNIDPGLTVAGTIEGVREFSYFSSSFYKLLWKTLRYIVIGLFLVVAMVFAGTKGRFSPDHVYYKTLKEYEENVTFKEATDNLEASWIELEKQRDVIDHILKPKKQIPKEPGRYRNIRFRKALFIMITIVVMIVVAVAWSQAREEIEHNPINYIPESIKPDN